MQPNLCLAKHCLLFILSVISCSIVSAQPGKDGVATVSTSGVIFNRYDVLGAPATAGATTITVANISNLSASAIAGAANNPYITDALSTGDLIMIIKMQGATIDVTNTFSYGAISNYNGTGLFETRVVQSVSGNTVTISPALSNAYTVNSTNRVQVVRIPRFTSLTINSGASLTGQAWGSAYKGGVVALEVYGNAVVNGTITADGIGFRGAELTTHTSQHLGWSDYATSTSTNAAIKGEGIAGYRSDLGTTYYGRGAPANGGGGGCAHNSGGGGGSNAGTGTWNGQGNPDVSGTNWSVAWNLEGAGFSTNISSGGGRGGYSYSLRNRNPMSPGTGPNAWQGDDRRNVGGLGGRPLTYSTGTLFMGGGGGAGDQNNSAGSMGANGGGIIHLTVTGTLSGTGNITANGNAASNTSPTHNDAAGGGGGGGAVRLNVQGTISGISVTASGGKGGDVLITSDEAYGPGGGGGGGYVGVVGTPSITMTVAGGANGITLSGGVTEFIPNGATAGSTGSPVTALAFVSPIDVPLPVNLKCFDILPEGADRIRFHWTAYDEVDVWKYDLEQSTNLQHWSVSKTAHTLPGNDPVKEYSVTLNKPSDNTYYRIKAVDNDGSYKYTCVRFIKSSGNRIAITESNGKLSVMHLNTSCNLSLFNSTGHALRLQFTRTPSLTTIDKAGLPKGLYYLQVLSGQERLVYDFIVY